MAFKPNYNQQRNERERLKQARKDEKLRQREEAAAARRKAEQETAAPAESQADEPRSS